MKGISLVDCRYMKKNAECDLFYIETGRSRSVEDLYLYVKCVMFAMTRVSDVVYVRKSAKRYTEFVLSDRRLYYNTRAINFITTLQSAPSIADRL
jgi:hypothetical protein